MTRRAPLLAVLAAVVLVLAGCDPDTPKPNYSSVSPTPSTSTSASPTASPSPTVPTTGPNVSPGETPPTEPAAVRENSREGALAFLAYYYRSSDWAFATSDAGFLESFFATNCSACSQGQENLESLFASGQYVTGGRITTQSTQVVTNDGRQGAELAVTGVFQVGAADVHSASGEVIKSYPANDDLQLTDWLKWSGDRWLIVDEAKA